MWLNSFLFPHQSCCFFLRYYFEPVTWSFCFIIHLFIVRAGIWLWRMKRFYKRKTSNTNRLSFKLSFITSTSHGYFSYYYNWLYFTISFVFLLKSYPDRTASNKAALILSVLYVCVMFNNDLWFAQTLSGSMVCAIWTRIIKCMLSEIETWTKELRKIKFKETRVSECGALI